MSAYDFLKREEVSVAKDLAADPSLIDDLLEAGGPGATTEYRQMLAGIWSVAAKLRPQKRELLLERAACGSTFHLLIMILQQTLIHDMEQNERLELLGLIGSYMSKAQELGLQNAENMEQILREIMGIAIQEGVRYGRTDQISQSLDGLGSSHSTILNELVRTESMNTLVRLTHWKEKDGRWGTFDDEQEDTAQNLVNTFLALSERGSDLNVTVEFMRGESMKPYETPERGPLILGLAWLKRRGSLAGELADVVVEAGADWLSVLQGPLSDPRDHEVLLQVTAIRRRKLEMDITDTHHSVVEARQL